MIPHTSYAVVKATQDVAAQCSPLRTDSMIIIIIVVHTVGRVYMDPYIDIVLDSR